MTFWTWLVASVVLVLIAWAALVGVLVAVGRRSGAGAVARFVPDCLVLLRRLLGDPRVAWWRKALLLGTIAYLASPLDLIPDFIPIAGQLDDAIVVVLVLRAVLRGAGEPLLRELWPGPEASLRVLERAALGRGA